MRLNRTDIGTHSEETRLRIDHDDQRIALIHWLHSVVPGSPFEKDLPMHALHKATLERNHDGSVTMVWRKAQKPTTRVIP